MQREYPYRMPNPSIMVFVQGVSAISLWSKHIFRNSRCIPDVICLAHGLATRLFTAISISRTCVRFWTFTPRRVNGVILNSIQNGERSLSPRNGMSGAHADLEYLRSRG